MPMAAWLGFGDIDALRRDAIGTPARRSRETSGRSTRRHPRQTSYEQELVGRGVQP